jgi:hypothetical protein
MKPITQMFRSSGPVLVSALALLPFLATPVFAEEAGLLRPATTYHTVTGTIAKIQSGVIYVKTPGGEMRVNARFAARSGFSDAEVGQDVTMWVNENNIITDIYKTEGPIPVHRLMTGTLVNSSDLKNEITLGTPEGGKMFSVIRNRSKLSALGEGTLVTLELNQAGEVVDFHTIGMAVQLTPEATGRPGSHRMLEGTVSKIGPELITVDTPVGHVTLSTKFFSDVGLPNVKVGQEMAMWVNENNTVMDLRKKGDPAPVHRLIIGEFMYAPDDRAEVKLWTPEGEKTFPVLRGKSQFSTVREGDVLRLELNEAGHVVDVHKAG